MFSAAHSLTVPFRYRFMHIRICSRHLQRSKTFWRVSNAMPRHSLWRMLWKLRSRQVYSRFPLSLLLQAPIATPPHPSSAFRSYLVLFLRFYKRNYSRANARPIPAIKQEQ